MKKILSVVLFGYVICSCLLSVFAAEPVYKEYTVTVSSGETLWDIAGRHTEAKEDVRDVVDRIAKASNLKSKYIYPGQVLKVPVRYESSGLMVAQK